MHLARHISRSHAWCSDKLWCSDKHTYNMACFPTLSGRTHGLRVQDVMPGWSSAASGVRLPEGHRYAPGRPAGSAPGHCCTGATAARTQSGAITCLCAMKSKSRGDEHCSMLSFLRSPLHGYHLLLTLIEGPWKEVGHQI